MCGLSYHCSPRRRLFRGLGYPRWWMLRDSDCRSTRTHTIPLVEYVRWWWAGIRLHKMYWKLLILWDRSNYCIQCCRLFFISVINLCLNILKFHQEFLHQIIDRICLINFFSWVTWLIYISLHVQRSSTILIIAWYQCTIVDGHI